MTLVRFCVIICNAEKVEGCPSGQRGQAVNLVGDGPSEVRILLPPPFGFLPFASPQQNHFVGALVARSPSEVFFAWRLMVGGAGIEPATFGL